MISLIAPAEGFAGGRGGPQGVHDGFAGSGCVAWPVAHDCFKDGALESGYSNNEHL